MLQVVGSLAEQILTATAIADLMAQTGHRPVLTPSIQDVLETQVSDPYFAGDSVGSQMDTAVESELSALAQATMHTSSPRSEAGACYMIADSGPGTMVARRRPHRARQSSILLAILKFSPCEAWAAAVVVSG